MVYFCTTLPPSPRPSCAPDLDSPECDNILDPTIHTHKNTQQFVLVKTHCYLFHNKKMMLAKDSEGLKGFDIIQLTSIRRSRCGSGALAPRQSSRAGHWSLAGGTMHVNVLPATDGLLCLVGSWFLVPTRGELF